MNGIYDVWNGHFMIWDGPFSLRSRRDPLGPVIATLWSVMIPSGLSSVLSSMKMALTGLGWSTCVRVGPLQLSPERGPFGLKLAPLGLT